MERMLDWRAYYWRWLSQAVVPGLRRADDVTALVGYAIALIIATLRGLGAQLSGMSPLEIFGTAALAIIGLRLVYLPYRFAREEAEKKAALEARLTPKVRLAYEANDIYVHRLPYTTIFLTPTEMVRPPAIWFRAEVVSVSEKARNCRVVLRRVEFFANDRFEPTSYDGALPLRWSYLGKREFLPCDICTELQPQYLDVVSADEHFNALKPKWPDEFIINEHVFAKTGIYRLTLTASADDSATASMKLLLFWPGRWDLTEMHPEDAMPADEMKRRFDKLLLATLTKPPIPVSGKPEAECPTSDADSDACCDETQTPTDTSGDASR